MDEAKADTAYKMAQQVGHCHACDLVIWIDMAICHSSLPTLAIPLPGQTMKQNLAAKKKQLNTMKQERTSQSDPCFCNGNALS